MDDAEAPGPLRALRELLVRSPLNPILTPEAMPFPCRAVTNPGATEFEGDVLLLLRVEVEPERSSLYVARSRDGLTGWRIETEPLLAYGGDWYDEWGCEDARITYLADEGRYVIAYAGVSHFGAGVCLATTTDFRTVERLGLVIHPYNKDAVLFPEKVDGTYRMLHRPTMGHYEDVWMSESDDLIHWGRPKNVLQESDRPGWQGGKIGAGAPPFRFDEGWLAIYHGVEREGDKWTYRMGTAILDAEHPQRVVCSWPGWVMEPEEPYEFDAKGQGIVFPTGLVRRGDRSLLYYGAGDRCVGVAVGEADQLRRVSRELMRALGSGPGAPADPGRGS